MALYRLAVEMRGGLATFRDEMAARHRWLMSFTSATPRMLAALRGGDNRRRPTMLRSYATVTRSEESTRNHMSRIITMSAY